MNHFITHEIGSLAKPEWRVKAITDKPITQKEIDEAIKIEEIDENKLEEEIAAIIKEKPGLRANAYMGLVIAKLGSGLDKRKAMEILNRLAK